MTITSKSPAKINLVLKIVGKRPDGYHEILSVFQKLDLCDTLSFTPRDDGRLTLACDNPVVPLDGANLIIKAAEALRKHAGVKAGVDITLIKRIPIAAGLGGGSSNAAITLRTLNGLWRLNVPQKELTSIALSIGADTPFFMGDWTCALVEGIGEKITPLNPRTSFPLLLVKPLFGISAKEAYQGSRFDFKGYPDVQGLIDDVESGEPARLARRLDNDLQPWAVQTHPELVTLLDRMMDTKPGPLKTIMSGSGSTLFGIYESWESLAKACENLKTAAPFVMAANSLV
ncbi:MAG: 4-(cytidine 5'-diphospho)-2-C-methyl-D-erythritol kinase [Nitrospinae bacterium]|nr:4-(cytidine 5'-diphospho)-2-C-methyl-D-erythritol kinase [Nitrospinota bacterium]